MKKQTQAIHLEYERRDAYDSLSVPVYNPLPTNSTMQPSWLKHSPTRLRLQIIRA